MTTWYERLGNTLFRTKKRVFATLVTVGAGMAGLVLPPEVVYGVIDMIGQIMPGVAE